MTQAKGGGQVGDYQVVKEYCWQSDGSVSVRCGHLGFLDLLFLACLWNLDWAPVVCV